MANKKVWVDDKHYCITHENRRKSYLYKSDGLSSHPVEVTDHFKNGTSRAHEVDNSIIGGLFHGFKGKAKS